MAAQVRTGREVMDLLAQTAQNRIWVLLIAAAVDLLIGDPPGLWHPVQGIGTVISLGESFFRRLFGVPFKKEADHAGRERAEGPGAPEVSKDRSEAEDPSAPEAPKDGTEAEGPSAPEAPKGGTEAEAASAWKTQKGQTEAGPGAFKKRERAAGVLTAVFVLLVSVGLTAGILLLCRRIHPWLEIAVEGLLCGRLLALRSLAEAGFSVRDPLREGRIEEARRAVSMIVGRDTERLDAEGIAKAAVETVAENTSDGVTAPLFYMILFGGLGGAFYKAVNTMDSMLGYRNDRYRYFGTAAARLDDLMNFVPSRLTALLMIAGCFLPGREAVPVEKVSSAGKETLTLYIPDGSAAFRIWLRDRLKSPSPNSAQTESVCAGALHLKLLGDTWYFGEVHHKKEIGDGERRIEAEDITRAVRLMRRGAALLFVIGILCLGLLAAR